MCYVKRDAVRYVSPAFFTKLWLFRFRLAREVNKCISLRRNYRAVEDADGKGDVESDGRREGNASSAQSTPPTTNCVSKNITASLL